MTTPTEPTDSNNANYQSIHLVANGETESYALISRVLGGGNPIETPDCAHPEFGSHITQEWDDDLNKYSFVFHIHLASDDDRCKTFDRQRNEIKTYDKSPEYLKGYIDETVTYRWRFKIDDGFQPSPNFTHLHQLKAVGGDSSDPIIALTARSGSPDRLEIGHRDSNGDRVVAATAPLELFEGEWVEVFERITYGHDGNYSIEVKSVDSGAMLLAFNDASIDMWRTAAEFVRPKWGIYRSLLGQEYLRDEQVRFDQFCLAKGTDDCP